MGHHGHGVGMDEVQQIEAGKRKRRRAQQGRVAPQPPAAQQQISAGEHQGIADSSSRSNATPSGSNRYSSQCSG